MAIQRLITGLTRLRNGWQERRDFRARAKRVTDKLKHGAVALHLTNANPFAAPGGLERFVLDSTRYARESLRISSLIVFPEPGRETHVGLLADHQSLEPIEYTTFKQLLGELSTRAHSFHLQHSMNWNLGRMHELLAFAEQSVARRILYVHDYHFVCHQHNLLWNDQQFCGPPESIENGLCSTCVYGPMLRPYRAAWSGLFETFGKIVVPSETSAQVLLKAYPQLKESIVVVPHLQAQPSEEVPATKAADKTIIVFSGATGFNKGIQRFTKLIETHREKYRWVTIGIEDYFRDNPLVEHIHFSIHEQGSPLQILQALKPAVAFLGSVVPETFSYTAHEMLAAGVPILTTPESGNIAAVVRKLASGRVYETFEEMNHELANVEAIATLAGEGKPFTVTLNREGLTAIYQS